MDQRKIMGDIAEKYKYLFISEYENKYDVIDIVSTDWAFSKTNGVVKERLIDYTIGFDLDNIRPNSGSVHSVRLMLNEFEEDIRGFLYKYPIDPITFRFTKNVDHMTISDGLILTLDYRLDELHKIYIEFMIDYDY